jgi:hypothetical protein
MMRASSLTLVARSLVALALFAGSAVAQDGSVGEAGKDAKGFFIKQGDTRLNFNGHFQYRYYANFRDEDAVGSQNDFTHGFGFRRVRLGASGQLTKELGFTIQGDFLNGETFRLFDAFASYKFSDSATLKFGQLFKLPVLKEELNSHLALQAVDRSTVNAVFTPNYSQGIQLDLSGDSVRGSFAVSDGFNALNSDFNSAAEADYALSARGEWKWAGEWKQLDMFTSWKENAYAGFLGGAIHYQSGGETGGTTDRQLFQYTADVSVKGDGWNIFAYGVGRRVEEPTADFDDFGALIQGGLFVSDQVELFARYGIVMPDDDRVNGDDFAEATLGANYYLIPKSQAAKFSLDGTYAFDDTTGSIVSQRVTDGLLTDSEEGEVYVRAQVQIVF